MPSANLPRVMFAVDTPFGAKDKTFVWKDVALDQVVPA